MVGILSGACAGRLRGAAHRRGFSRQPMCGEERFRLDEDAEGELIPRIEMLLLLCGHCGGVLPEKLDIAAWKARYLVMYDDQIDGMEPTNDYKQQQRVVIAGVFDRLIEQHKKQWQRLAE